MIIRGVFAVFPLSVARCNPCATAGAVSRCGRPGLNSVDLRFGARSSATPQREGRRRRACLAGEDPSAAVDQGGEHGRSARCRTARGGGAVPAPLTPQEDPVRRVATAQGAPELRSASGRAQPLRAVRAVGGPATSSRCRGLQRVLPGGLRGLHTVPAARGSTTCAAPCGSGSAGGRVVGAWAPGCLGRDAVRGAVSGASVAREDPLCGVGACLDDRFSLAHGRCRAVRGGVNKRQPHGRVSAPRAGRPGCCGFSRTRPCAGAPSGERVEHPDTARYPGPHYERALSLQLLEGVPRPSPVERHPNRAQTSRTDGG